ncbi:MAG: shikimate kinase [Phycisphaerales bacterium]
MADAAPTPDPTPRDQPVDGAAMPSSSSSTSKSSPPERAGRVARHVRPWIVIIGLRASGKSTVARSLARLRRVGWTDLDALVRERFDGRSVADIWADDGEAAFRREEAAALADVLDGRAPGILSLGGGTPMVDAAHRTLVAARQAGRIRIAYLAADPAFLTRRLEQRRGDRPDLTGGSIADEVAWAHGQRDGRYRELADVVLDVERFDVEPPRVTAATLDAAFARLDEGEQTADEDATRPDAQSDAQSDAQRDA